MDTRRGANWIRDRRSEGSWTDGQMGRRPTARPGWLCIQQHNLVERAHKVGTSILSQVQPAFGVFAHTACNQYYSTEYAISQMARQIYTAMQILYPVPILTMPHQTDAAIQIMYPVPIPADAQHQALSLSPSTSTNLHHDAVLYFNACHTINPSTIPPHSTATRTTAHVPPVYSSNSSSSPFCPCPCVFPTPHSALWWS
jgi:hypothetical protein